MPTAKLNGIDLYYEEQGSGEPLILIAGFTANSLSWVMQMAILAQKYRVITFDNRGIGRSEAPEGPYSTHQMADDTAALLEHLGVERAHVIGWSMGGMIAQELALAHPRKVRRLVLLSSLARGSEYADPWLNFMTQAYDLVQRGELDPTGFVLFNMPWTLTPAFLTQPQLVQAALQQLSANPYPATPRGIAGQAAACREHQFGDALERLRGIKAPTLVLVGAEDILTPPSQSREMAEHIPNARLQILEHGGHGMAIEYAMAVNEALLSFLGEQVPAQIPA
ncbi:MAG: alpha/beta fold hydrolase [Dehalococcoidia bacterium]